MKKLPAVVLSLFALEAHAMESSAAARAGRFVFVSGVRGADASGKLVPGGIQAQTRRALENAGAALKAAGSGLEQAASLHVYLRRAEDFQAMNEVYRGFFPTDPPVRTTIVSDTGDPETLIEISATGLAAGAERKVVHPEGWARSANPYSYGILSGDTLFLSGLVSRDPKDNSNVPGDVAAQTRTVLGNGGEILKAAGMSHADVASARVFITDTAKFQEMNAAYRSFFPQDPPARATVKAGLTNPAFLVEITMLAVKGPARQALVTPNADGTPGRPNPNLSSAIRAGERLYLSGMLGNTEATRGDAAAQTRETLARLGRTLTAAGFGWADVVDGLIYVPDAKDRPAVERVWRETLAGATPATSWAGTGLVAPDGLVEIMLVAAKK